MTDMPTRAFATGQWPLFPTIDVPQRLLDADFVEIRVSLTPLKYYEMNPPTSGVDRELRPAGETCHSQVCLDRYLRLDAKDTRAIFHIIRQLLVQMLHIYLEIEL